MKSVTSDFSGEGNRSQRRTAKSGQSFTFGIVDRKLVWLNFHAKLVEFIDLDELKQQSGTDQDFVGWA